MAVDMMQCVGTQAEVKVMARADRVHPYLLPQAAAGNVRVRPREVVSDVYAIAQGTAVDTNETLVYDDDGDDDDEAGAHDAALFNDVEYQRRRRRVLRPKQVRVLCWSAGESAHTLHRTEIAIA
jgi:hypothetical protein